MCIRDRIICLSNLIDNSLCQKIIEIHGKLSPDVVRVVLSEKGFADDVVKTNAMQILNQAGITDVKTL